MDPCKFLQLCINCPINIRVLRFSPEKPFNLLSLLYSFMDEIGGSHTRYNKTNLTTISTVCYLGKIYKFV